MMPDLYLDNHCQRCLQ